MDGKLGTYQTIETHGKSQVELIIKVYDGAIAAFRSAQTEFKQGQNSAGREKLEQARKFVTHLYTTLDPEAGGEIADNLSRLYAYIVNQTNVVEATKDSSLIDDITTILDNLRLGWLGIKQQQIENPARAEESAGRSLSEHFTTTG
jgi:flagellar protein FliS